MRRCRWRPVLALTEHVGGGWGGETREKNKNFSSPVACPGEEEGEIVSSKNDIVLLFLFFFGKYMKPRRFLEITQMTLE
jgi:hypothetical protein